MTVKQRANVRALILAIKKLKHSLTIRRVSSRFESAFNMPLGGVSQKFEKSIRCTSIPKRVTNTITITESIFEFISIEYIRCIPEFRSNSTPSTMTNWTSAFSKQFFVTIFVED